MKHYRRIFALVLAGVLLLACACCGGLSNRSFPMQGTNLSDLQPEEIIRNIVRITGATDDNIAVPVWNFISGLHVTGDFDWYMDGAISLVAFSKKRLVGTRDCSCQLHINLEDSQFYVTEPSKLTSYFTRRFDLKDYLEALKYLPQEQIRRLMGWQPDMYSINIVLMDSMPDDDKPCIFYDMNGLVEERNWQIRLDILPMKRSESDDGYAGVGEDFIHLFYAASPDISAQPLPSLGEPDITEGTTVASATMPDVSVPINFTGYDINNSIDLAHLESVGAVVLLKEVMKYRDFLEKYDDGRLTAIDDDQLVWVVQTHFPNGFETKSGFFANAITTALYDAETGFYYGFSVTGNE